jgi:hypothetical protein
LELKNRSAFSTDLDLDDDSDETQSELELKGYLPFCLPPHSDGDSDWLLNRVQFAYLSSLTFSIFKLLLPSNSLKSKIRKKGSRLWQLPASNKLKMRGYSL